MDNRSRQRIAILFNFRKGWMGGIVYIINLINALNFLDDKNKPEVLVFYNQDLEKFIPDIKYPYLQVIPWKFPSLIKGYFLSLLTGQNIFAKEIIETYSPDGIYPLNDWPVSNAYFVKNNVRVVAWFPDLQHKFYPHFFSRVRVIMREWRIKLILKNTNDLAVSSQDVKSHFERFYTLRPDLQIHVLRFVTILPESQLRSIEEMATLYKLPSHYFIVSNQFTNHKNHILILEAIKLLKEKGSTVHFVFTGKTDFKGNEVYIAKIRAMIKEFSLESHVSILGVIPRLDQLSLMKHSQAVVQPSFFEGWSTVIEDAKTLYVPVLAANLAVNIEQLGNTGIFFDPNDATALAALLDSYRPDGRHLNYEPFSLRAKNFASNFVRIFK